MLTLHDLRKRHIACWHRITARARWMAVGIVIGAGIMYAICRFVWEVPPAVQDAMMGLRS